MKEEKENFFYVLVVLFVLFVFLYFFRLGSIGLIDVDEPRYAEAGREMLESGNFIVPYFNYGERFDKPVFFYWLEAISMKVFGVGEFGARFPSVASSFLCLALLFYFLKTFYNTLCALIGTLVLMSSFEFAGLSRFSVTDMTLTSFISSSIFCFFLGYNEIITSHRFFTRQIGAFSFWYIAGFVFLALAFLTKGPVAVIVTLLVIVPFFWWTGRLDYFFKNTSFYIGLILFMLLVLPWYLAVHFATSGEFTKAFFGIHNFSRYTSVVSQHKGSLFYFIPVVLIGFLPWSFFLVQSINVIIKKGLKSLQKSIRSQVPWFALWWFLVVLLFFSISRTKLLTYILPLFPALAVMISFWFYEILERNITARGLVIGLGVFFVFSLCLLFVCVSHPDILFPREIKDIKLNYLIILFAFLMFVGVSMSWASSHKDPQGSFVILLSTFLLIYFSVVQILMPKIDKHSQLLLRQFASSFSNDVEIATYEIVKPSLTFYGRRQISKYDSLDLLQERLHHENKFAFVTKKTLLSNVQLNNTYLWGSDSRYVFYTNFPVAKL